MNPGSALEHVCWSYDELADFQAYAADFLGAGVSAGEAVWYVGAGTAPAFLAGFGDAARYVDVTQAYGVGQVLDPEVQIATYGDATAAALAAGYTGLRVAAEVSELLRTTEQREAFARYEFAVSRLMITAPYRAVCGYDRALLGESVIREFACLHPRSSAGAAPFHMHPADGLRVEIVINGELDAAGEDLFATALRRAEPGRPIHVHGGGLRFIDHRSLLTLERYATERDTTAVVHAPHTSARRLADLMGLKRVEVAV